MVDEIQYTVDEMAPMPFGTHQSIFAFWPDGSESHPYENFMKGVYDWCLENFGRHGWYVSRNKVFVDNKHAVAFKLRWI